MRAEAETIVSPLLTFEYRAVPYTLGRRKRPRSEPRDQGLNGYFGRGWNDDLARPVFESVREKIKAELQTEIALCCIGCAVTQEFIHCVGSATNAFFRSWV
jgi:hypothetical protein